MNEKTKSLLERLELKKDKFWDNFNSEDENGEEEFMANDLLDDAIRIMKIQDKLIEELMK